MRHSNDRETVGVGIVSIDILIERITHVRGPIYVKGIRTRTSEPVTGAVIYGVGCRKKMFILLLISSVSEFIDYD